MTKLIRTNKYNKRKRKSGDKFKVKFFILISLIIIFVIGLGRMLPIPFFSMNFSETIHYFFYQSSLYCYILLPVVFSLIIICFYLNILKLKIIVYTLLYISLIFSEPVINDFNNKIIIFMNNNKDIDDFYNPILGRVMLIENQSSGNKVMFRFNGQYLTNDYDELVYQPNHGLNIDSWDGDLSLHRIYNENWWWYKNID